MTIRYVRRTMTAVALASMAVGAAWAQVPPPAPAPVPGADRPMTETTRPVTGTVEGTVKKVDPAAGTVKISSGLFGLFGKTLQVGPDTQVSVDGRDSSLAAVREGTKVKASYETRNGLTIATRIEAMPSAQTSGRRSS
jgi:Cu/Ag efflux protein CusF